ncbi:MAG TPA: YkgJ family cysteine cluster protein [Candidatus Gastranaerophilales bacterium]|nr:YkgJ family cysteine cluster protein [Candidatus Gastranaerophilales bacterium]
MNKNIILKFQIAMKSLKIFLYELFPNLMFEKANYRLEGDCNKCGDCCRFIYCLEPFSKLDFKLMRFFFPKYKRFKIIGEDSAGNLVLACSLIREDGLCPDYKNRPGICRAYPDPKKIYSGGKLYKRCSYKLISEKSFENYIQNSKNTIFKIL